MGWKNKTAFFCDASIDTTKVKTVDALLITQGSFFVQKP
jgi:hypothetical protein